MATSDQANTDVGVSAASGAITGLAAGPIGALLGGISGGVAGASKGGLLNCLFGCPKKVVPPTPWYEQPLYLGLLATGLVVAGLGIYVYKKRH